MPVKTNPALALRSQLMGLQSTYHEYPGQFWIVVLGTFIDRLGGAMLFPFLTLYITRRFGVGMTEVGVIFGLYSISSVVGSMVGGAMTDRFGRKIMLIFGLVMTALSSVGMGLIGRFELFYPVILIVGMLAESGGPAQQAVVADLLPEEKRAEGFGILRVGFNLAVAIGPLLGGLLASRSYLLLFIADAVTSLITAAIIYFTLRETWSPQEHGEAPQTVGQTFGGYLDVLRDSAFAWFLGACVLMVLVYMNMNTTLSVYLRDNHGVNVQGFSYILSLNAIMVVLFQFPITRWIDRYRPLLVMAAGTLLYAAGFAMYGLVSTYFLFLVAMVVITVGEMMVSPVGQAIVSRLAPEEMRGRYMAVFGFSWVIPFAIGPLLAGLVMDNLNPNWLWYASGMVGLVAAGLFYLMELRVGRSRWAVVDERLRVLEQLEQGRISAEAAGRMLEGMGEPEWGRLTTPTPEAERRHVRIRVSDLQTGAMKVDLRLPIALVNTVLNMGGQLAPGLAGHYNGHLKDLISRSVSLASPQDIEANGEKVEVSLE